MRAIIKGDIIKCSPNGIDVGPIPRHIGTERLRWNGNRIIDLMNLNEIHVEYLNGKFTLHCIPMKNTQLVQMTYDQRCNLINDKGIIRVKTSEELQLEKDKIVEDKTKAIKRTRLRKQIGDTFDRSEDLEKIVHILMKVVIEGDSNSKKVLEDYLNNTPNLVDLQNDKIKLLENALKKDQIYKKEGI